MIVRALSWITDECLETIVTIKSSLMERKPYVLQSGKHSRVVNTQNRSRLQGRKTYWSILVRVSDSSII